MSPETPPPGTSSPAAPQPAALPPRRSPWTKVLLVLAAAIVGLIVLIALQPAEFRIERSTVIAAPPDRVFAEVNDFHRWQAWSPWAKLDPNSKETYDGPAEGQGANFRWDGNEEVGQGSMTIVDSKPPEVVRIKLEFFRPFQATNTAEFVFEPEGEQTKVTWSMFGHNSFLFKAFHLVMSMDEMVGKDFEKGLARLKSVVESGTPAASAAN